MMLEQMIDEFKREYPELTREEIRSIIMQCDYDLNCIKIVMRKKREKHQKNDKWIQLDLELTEDDDLYKTKIGGGNSGGLNF